MSAKKFKAQEADESSLEKYLYTIRTYFRKIQCDNFPPFDRSGLQRVTMIVSQAKMALDKGESLCNKLTRLLEVYDVLNVEDELKLVRKVDVTSQQPVFFYISCEDAYEHIHDAHCKTHHGGFREIMDDLKKKRLIVSEKAIKLYLSLCEVCQSYGACSFGAEPIVQFNDKWAVTISVFNKHGATFSYILFVVDEATGYTHLRPLESNDKMAVAIEFIKLFADFGRPSVIETKTEKFFHSVATCIQNLCPDYTVKVNFVITDFTELIYRVENSLNDWQQCVHTGKNKNWEFGVYMVQWKINNTLDFTDRTHFKNVFSKTPKSHFVDDDYLRPIDYNKAKTKYKVGAKKSASKVVLKGNIPGSIIMDMDEPVFETSSNVQTCNKTAQGSSQSVIAELSNSDNSFNLTLPVLIIDNVTKELISVNELKPMHLDNTKTDIDFESDLKKELGDAVSDFSVVFEDAVVEDPSNTVSTIIKDEVMLPIDKIECVDPSLPSPSTEQDGQSVIDEAPLENNVQIVNNVSEIPSASMDSGKITVLSIEIEDDSDDD